MVLSIESTANLSYRAAGATLRLASRLNTGVIAIVTTKLIKTEYKAA
jgi:hypothetical protein